MQELNINGKTYNITFKQGSVEVEYDDENTGLRTVFVFKKLEITEGGIRTEIHQFQITPTGERIDTRQYTRNTSEADYNNFIASPIADLILKYIVNGMFRFLIQTTDKVYDEQGNLITNQPVLPPDETV